MVLHQFRGRISDGSGFDRFDDHPNKCGQWAGPTHNSGDGIPDDSGFN